MSTLRVNRIEPYTGSIINIIGLTVESASYSTTASYALNSAGVALDTSSFVKAEQTASMTVLSASYAANVVTIDTGSFVTNSQTGSFVQNESTASFITNSQTASFATVTQLNSVTASINTLNSQTSSYVTTSGTGSLTVATASYALYAVSASYEINYETSSSYAETASLARLANTASYIDPAFISASAAASGFGSGGGGAVVTGSGLSIGDYYQGGYVIQTYDNGTHGLILAATTGSDSQFKNSTSQLVLTWPYNNWTSSLNPFMFSSSIDASGYNMTNALRYSGGALGNGFAIVQTALDVDNSASFAGYSDWHLPGLIEADMIKSNILLLNAKIIEAKKSGSNHTVINHQFWLCHRPSDLTTTAYLFSPGQGYTATPAYQPMLTSTTVTTTKPNRYLRRF